MAPGAIGWFEAVVLMTKDNFQAVLERQSKIRAVYPDLFYPFNDYYQRDGARSGAHIYITLD